MQAALADIIERPSPVRPHVKPLEYDDVLDVATNMREWDKREIYATRWSDDPAALARDCMIIPDFGWTIWLDKPLCAIGAVPLHPGVWSVWMFAKDDFPTVGLYATKFARRVMMPGLVNSGARRAQCLSIEGHEDAHKWLRLLGAKAESRLWGFGKNGEDFHCFAWSSDDVRTRSIR